MTQVLPPSIDSERETRLLPDIAPDAEALIKEARQRQLRRRWVILVAALLVIVAIAVAIEASPPARRPARPIGSSTRGPSGGTTSGQAATTPASVNFYGKGWGVFSISFPNATDGFTNIGGLLERTTDGGRNWQALSSPGLNTYVAFNSAEDGWSYGALQPNMAALLQTTDGGRTWRKIPTKGSVFSLVTSGRTAWLVETRQNSKGVCRAEMFRSSVPGRLSRVAIPPNVNGSCWWQLVAASASTVYAVADGNDGKSATVPYFVTTDAGSSWTRRASPCHGSWPTASLGGTGASLWLTCATGDLVDMAGDRMTTLYRSQDSGRTWRRIATYVGIGSLLAVGPTTAWQWYEGNGDPDGFAERTSDGGVAWSVRFSARSSLSSIRLRPSVGRVDGVQVETMEARADSAALVIETSRFPQNSESVNRFLVGTTQDGGQSWRWAYLPNLVQAEHR